MLHRLPQKRHTPLYPGLSDTEARARVCVCVCVCVRASAYNVSNHHAWRLHPTFGRAELLELIEIAAAQTASGGFLMGWYTLVERRSNANISKSTVRPACYRINPKASVTFLPFLLWLTLHVVFHPITLVPSGCVNGDDAAWHANAQTNKKDGMWVQVLGFRVVLYARVPRVHCAERMLIGCVRCRHFQRNNSSAAS